MSKTKSFTDILKDLQKKDIIDEDKENIDLKKLYGSNDYEIDLVDFEDDNNKENEYKNKAIDIIDHCRKNNIILASSTSTFLFLLKSKIEKNYWEGE